MKTDTHFGSFSLSSSKNEKCFRQNLHINNQQDAPSIQNFILSWNYTCFGHLLSPSSGVISCRRGNWYVSCRLCGRCLGESGWNLHETYQLQRVQLITPDDGHRRCLKHVEFRDKIKFWILDASYTKIITLHGYLNIRFQTEVVETIKTHFAFNNFFRNPAIYEIMWNNIL
jgi:hypothetical protein